MTRCAVLLSVVLPCGFFSFSPPVEAQRNGLIIDVGLGPGAVSSKTSIVGFGISDRESKVGLGASFNLGGVVGNSLELYWTNHLIFHTTARQGADRAITGITGVGVTYPLNPGFSIKGAVGLGRESLYMDGWSNLFDTSTGLGVLAGGRHGLSDRWALDFDIMYLRWNDGDIAGSERVSVWGAGLTVTWMSL